MSPGVSADREPSVAETRTAVQAEGTGRRRTRQQSAIAALLDESAGFHTVQELYHQLREAGEKVGLATVYRTLHTLAGRGDVDVIRTTQGETLYRHCSSGHHHHLVCRRCGRAVEITNPGLMRWIAEIAAENGYRDIDHELEISGICPACARSRHQR